MSVEKKDMTTSPLTVNGAGRHASTPPKRRRDLDLMRMAVVFGLIFFHSARIFDTSPWYVKNNPTSDLVIVVLGFAAIWAMPLLFVIAGMGIWYSLRSRTMSVFAVERFRRLLVPLLFGILVMVPPQIWIRLRGERPLMAQIGFGTDRKLPFTTSLN